MLEGRLSKYFHVDEFACKCGCGISNINPDFLKMLTVARRIADVPFVITSGCRCPSHNCKVGSESEEDHAERETQ